MDASLCCGRFQLHRKARKSTASAIEGRGLAAIAPIAASELVTIKGGRNAPLAVISLLWAAALIRGGSRSDWLSSWLPLSNATAETAGLAALRAGFEPATYCLGGISAPSPDVAGRGLTGY